MHKNKHIEIDILDNSPSKTQYGKANVAREDFFIHQLSSTTRCQTRLPKKEKKFSSSSPSPSIILANLFVALKHFVSTPTCLCQPWASLCHPHRPFSGCIVSCCLSIYLKCAASTSPISALVFCCWYWLSSPYFLPHAALQTTSLNFSANLTPEIEMTGLPQYVLQLTLKPFLILFSLVHQRSRLNP